jgi:oligopeptide/dipeptide ABC transporter ATP-binding protein
LTILKAENITKRFPIKRNFLGKPIEFITAVNDVSLKIGEKETVGVIGESGCGKSTLAKIILNLESPDRGNVFFKGKPINKMNKEEYKNYRKNVQAVFQNPQSSLNPRMKIWEIVTEGLKINLKLKRDELKKKAIELLELTRLSKNLSEKHPHQLSGGQKQRVAIARALALNPEIIVADEPTSALDVSVQAQIVNLLLDLQDKFGISYLFISHSIPIVESISDYVIVMYKGMILEEGKTNKIFPNPAHPYTKLLVSCIPVIDHRKRKVIKLPQIEMETSKGCPFYSRCQVKKDICSREIPKLKEIEENHKVACFLF